MHTSTAIDIAGSIDLVWDLASAVEQWPVLLPHYRYVRVLSDRGASRTLAMSARRDWLPVRWVASVERDPALRRIYFQHVGGAAKGMRVEWRIDRVGERVRAEIVHELESPYWILRTRLGEHILGEYFVATIAGRTLRRIKHLAETLQADEPGPVHPSSKADRHAPPARTPAP